MASSSNGEPSTAPQPNRWYDLRLGSSCRDPSSTAAKFCTLRYEFKPASIDKSQAGSLQSTKDNRVTVEFHNNQHGKPKVTFEGSQEEYKDNDGVLFFDGESFRLERLHRAVKRLRHVRVPGESNLAAATTAMGAESHSPPLPKIGKSQSMGEPAVPSVPVEVERIDIGEPENPGPRYNNRSTTHQPVTTNPFEVSPDPDDQEENLDIIGDDDDNGSPNNVALGQGTSVRGFDINLPNQHDLEDEIADVDVNDEADEGVNAAEVLRAQASAEGQKVDSSSTSGSSSGGSSSSGSGSGSGSSSSGSGSDGSDGDSASSGGDVDI